MRKEMQVNIDEAYSKIAKSLYASKGNSLNGLFQDSMYGLDSIHGAMHMSEIEDHGLTFFTRPMCNLTSANLKSDRITSMLDSLDPRMIAFAVRAFLDTKFIGNYKIPMKDSLFVNDANPFITILSNRLVGLSGWPDPVLDIFTSDQGFFSESITYPNGWDQLTKAYDLTATFNDIQGSVVLMTILMWTRYLMQVTRGILSAYMEDIEDRRLGFTSSIYRFVMDPSKQYITKWAKATGTFPRSIPLGAYFNYDYNAANVDTSMNMSVPFSVAGKVDYLDPVIFLEFNTLVKRFNPGIESFTVASPQERVKLNHLCLPYIDMLTNKLEWRFDEKDARVTERLEMMTTKMEPLKPTAVKPAPAVPTEAIIATDNTTEETP